MPSEAPHPGKKLTILVTGATDGIGRETAGQLAALGHDVIVHGRNEQKTRETVQQLEARVGRALPRPIVADLASLDAVRTLAADVAARGPLDVLLENAGIYAKGAFLSQDGHELTVAVNHLAHFALAGLLLPALSQAPQGRVVVVSSVAHGRGVVDFDALESKKLQKNWDGYGAYAESKLMNVMFTAELARRIAQGASSTTKAASKVTVNCLHPGVVSTKLLKEGFEMEGPDSHETGAATSVMLCTDPSLSSTTGKYFVRQKPAPFGAPARDAAACERLWALSAKHTGVDV